MAQFSWTILESRPACLHKALKAVEKCNHDISQTLHSSSHKTRILSQLDTFVNSLNEISEKASFTDYTEELPSLFFTKAVGVVQLHPSYLGNVNNGIFSYLSNFLMHYNDDFGGVWISCANFKLLDSLGFLTTGDFQSIISLRIAVRVLTFVPKLDVIIGISMLIALFMGVIAIHLNMASKISRIRPQSISVLVYGIFNVVVKPENLSKVKHEGSSYKLYFGDKIVIENTLITMKLISVNVLTKNRSLNLSAILQDNFINE